MSPARVVPLPPDTMPRDVAVACIYRAANARIVDDILRTLPPQWPVRLWALDEVAEPLRAHTVGCGVGGRIELLNRLVESIPGDPDDIVLMDDDIEFLTGSVVRLVHAGASLELDLFQPSHSRRSRTAFRFGRKRPLLFARETGFVEQGPVVVLSRRARQALLPLPEELVMGWGIEVRWHRAAIANHLRLGIVDAIAIRHDPLRGQSAHTYDTAPEIARLDRELASAGLSDIRDLQTTSRTISILQAWRRFAR
jgi:hypothetical protein